MGKEAAAMTRIIKRIPKRTDEEIRVSTIEYRGMRAVDVRLFYKLKNEFLPTRKGFILKKELVKELIAALRQV